VGWGYAAAAGATVLILARSAPDTIQVMGLVFGTVLAVQLATGGKGYGMWTPALVGLAAAIAGFTVMLTLGAGRRREARTV